MTTFIESVVGSYIELATTKNHNHIAYLRMPRDFHSILSQIPYFAIGDYGSEMILLSEDVPKEFRDIWVIHQDSCNKFNGAECAKLTKQEIEMVRLTFMHDEYIIFLKMRLVMFQAMIDIIPNDQMKPNWEASFKAIEESLGKT